MSRPILGFLADFTVLLPPLPVEDEEHASSAPAPDPAAAAVLRMEAMLEAARQEGAAEARRLADEAADARCQRLADDYATALDAARARWAEAEGAALATRLAEGLATLEKTIADALAAVVTPLVQPAIRQRTIDDLADALRELMAGNHGAIIEIRGPDDLIEPVRAAQSGQTALVLRAADAVDVVVEAADTTIRSQLQAWSDRFEKALLTA